MHFTRLSSYANQQNWWYRNVAIISLSPIPLKGPTYGNRPVYQWRCKRLGIGLFNYIFSMLASESRRFYIIKIHFIIWRFSWKKKHAVQTNTFIFPTPISNLNSNRHLIWRTIEFCAVHPNNVIGDVFPKLLWKGYLLVRDMITIMTHSWYCVVATIWKMCYAVS